MYQKKFVPSLGAAALVLAIVACEQAQEPTKGAAVKSEATKIGEVADLVGSSNQCAMPAKTVLERPFQHVNGNAFIAMVPHLSDLSDTNDNPRRSPAMLCEDGKPLGPSHTPHVDIQSRGRGAFSHYMGGLIFSTSDNSDPNQNGRSYWLAIPPGSK